MENDDRNLSRALSALGKTGTQCVESLKKHDCEAPQRICRITTIRHRRPMTTEVAVVLVNEALGF